MHVSTFIWSACGFPGGETPRSGQAGVTQHSQKTECLPAGSAGDWYGEEICKVTFCEYGRQSCWQLLKFTEVCVIFFSMYHQKKLPLTILAQCMEEGAAVLGEDSLLGLVTTNTPVLNSHTHRVIFNYRFGSWILLCPYCPCVHFNCIWLLMTLCLAFTNRKMLKLCGETEEKLAQELIQFEYQIERDVVEPLYVLAEVSR